MTDAAASEPQDPPQSSSTSGPLGRDSSDDADASSKPATTTQAQKVDKITALQDGIGKLNHSLSVRLIFSPGACILTSSH